MAITRTYALPLYRFIIQTELYNLGESRFSQKSLLDILNEVKMKIESANFGVIPYLPPVKNRLYERSILIEISLLDIR